MEALGVRLPGANSGIGRLNNCGANADTKPMNESNESGLTEDEYWEEIESMAENAIELVKENDDPTGDKWLDYVWTEVDNSDVFIHAEPERVLEFTNANFRDDCDPKQAARESMEEDVISKMRMMH